MFHGVTGIAIRGSGSQKLIAAALGAGLYLDSRLLIEYFKSKMGTILSDVLWLSTKYELTKKL